MSAPFEERLLKELKDVLALFQDSPYIIRRRDGAEMPLHELMGIGKTLIDKPIELLNEAKMREKIRKGETRE